MSREEVRNVLAELKDVLETKKYRIDVFVNDVLLSNYSKCSEIVIDYEENLYTIHLVVNGITPVCTVIEESIKSLRFYMYKWGIKYESDIIRYRYWVYVRHGHVRSGWKEKEMRVCFKETNGNNILFVTDGVTVKAFYRTLEGLDLPIRNASVQIREICEELIEDDMLLPFDEIQGEDEWDEPYIDDLTEDCELVIDTEEYKHENSEY